MRRVLSLAICAVALLAGCSSPQPSGPESPPMQLWDADSADSLKSHALLNPESAYEEAFQTLARNCHEPSPKIEADINQALAALRPVNAFESRYTVMQQMVGLLASVTDRPTCASIARSVAANQTGR